MKVLLVGSSLIDFFINIEENEQIEFSDNKISLPLGAKLPIDIKSLSLGGNSANVASALHNLSIPASLYTYLGNDPLSKHIIEKMEERGVEILVENVDTTTGSLSLIFDFPTDRIIFSHHNTANYGFDEEKIEEKPDLIFLSSIGKTWESAYEKVLSYAENNSIPIAFSPGSQQLKDINETFIKTAKQSKMLFCNMEEAKIINKSLSGEEIEDVKDLLSSLKKYDFDVLSITDGKNGAYATYGSDDICRIISPEPDRYEKTGAGDAYAGAFLAGFLHKKSLEECMRWGVLNALGEMKEVGAGTGQLTLAQMEKQLSDSDLNVEKI